MSPRPEFSANQIAARRDAILEATLDQIVERGTEALRMKDVAEAAGVSVGTLQYYFGSRNDLLVEAFRAHSHMVVDAITDLSKAQGSGWEKMRASLAAVPCIGDARRRSQVWIELLAASSRNEFLRASVDEVFDQWRSHFQAVIDIGIRDGSLRPQTEADLIVDILIAAIDGFDVAAFSRYGPKTSEQIITSLEFTAAAMLGVTSEPSADVICLSVASQGRCRR